MAPGREGIILRFGRRKDDGSAGQDHNRRLRSRDAGRTVSDATTAANLGTRRLLLRREWRWKKIPDCHESGWTQCRPTLRPSELDFANGQIEAIPGGTSLC